MSKCIGCVLGLLCLLVTSCASTDIRFKDKPIVWQVDDELTIAEPEKIEMTTVEYHGAIVFTRRFTRMLELHDLEPAQNINALGEVPDSSWFTNRIGRRLITPEAAARGAYTKGEPQLPLTIVKGKSDGHTQGFWVTDKTGRLFILKTDYKGAAELHSASGVITNRIFWTIGYNVPANGLVKFCKKDLILSPEAKIKNDRLEKRKLTWTDIDGILATSPTLANGCYRAFVSEFLNGKPKGGFPIEGVRRDDPNDVIDHEHRREVRALKVFSSFVSHTDLTQGNTLDMYVEENGRRFLKHFFIDFNDSLGAHRKRTGRLEMGHEYYWDWEKQFLAAFSFGLHKRTWEYQMDTRWESVGNFSNEWFEATSWRGAHPYWPYREADANDTYWAAKIVMNFTRPILRAIINAGEYSDPAAANFVVETLIKRREKIGRAYFKLVTPFDYLTIKNGEICGLDLSIHHGIKKVGLLERLGEDGSVAQATYNIDASGKVCVPLYKKGGYQVHRLRIRRGDTVQPVMQVHVKNDGNPRILGIIRSEIAD